MTTTPSPELPDFDRPDALAPCPFCSTAMERFGAAQFNHPTNDCWLANVKVVPEEYNSWNRCAQPKGEAPQAVPMEPVAYITKRGAVYAGTGRPENGDRPLFLSSAAFVLPDMQSEDGYATDRNKGYSIGWNACREKVAEINLLSLAPAVQQAESGAQTIIDTPEFRVLVQRAAKGLSAECWRELIAYIVAAQSQGAQADKTRGTHAACRKIESNLRAALAAKAEAPAPDWGRVRTVGDMVRNLLTLDQADPIHAAFPIEFQGARRMRTSPITISRERVIDGKWVDQTRKDVPYAIVVWAKPDERAQQAATPDALQIDAIESLGRNDPAVHAFLTMKRRDELDWGDVLAQMVLHLASDKAALTARLLNIGRHAKPGTPGTPEAPKKSAHGHRDDYYLLDNGRRLGLEPISRVRNMPNWVLALELFATGSTSAHQICRDAGIDPDGTTVQRAAQLDGGQVERKKS